MSQWHRAFLSFSSPFKHRPSPWARARLDYVSQLYKSLVATASRQMGTPLPWWWTADRASWIYPSDHHPMPLLVLQQVGSATPPLAESKSNEMLFLPVWWHCLPAISWPSHQSPTVQGFSRATVQQKLCSWPLLVDSRIPSILLALEDKALIFFELVLMCLLHPLFPGYC